MLYLANPADRLVFRHGLPVSAVYWSLTHVRSLKLVMEVKICVVSEFVLGSTQPMLRRQSVNHEVKQPRVDQVRLGALSADLAEISCSHD